MGKRRITLLVDDEERARRGAVHYDPLHYPAPGITIESIENIPEPKRVQRFELVVKSPPSHNPWTSEYVDSLLVHGTDMLNRWIISVTEVEPHQ